MFLSLLSQAFVTYPVRYHNLLADSMCLLNAWLLRHVMSILKTDAWFLHTRKSTGWPFEHLQQL